MSFRTLYIIVNYWDLRICVCKLGNSLFCLKLRRPFNGTSNEAKDSIQERQFEKSWYLLTAEIIITECNTWYECNFSTKSVYKSVGN
jgi:hypothetical protein